MPTISAPAPVAPGGPAPVSPSPKKKSSLFDPDLRRAAVGDSFRKLDPRTQLRNPVMFIVYLGAIATTVISFGAPTGFNLQVTLWLWFTVLFANFAEAIAEGRGKAQAATLRKMRATTMARRLVSGKEERVPAGELRRGDRVICEAGDIIPADGDVIEGIASVDESALTGESAPVIRESGGDHSAVTGGTRVISDRIVVQVTAEPGNTFLDRMISMVESATRGRTPNEIALGILLVSLTIIFLLAVCTLRPMAQLSERLAGQSGVIDVSVVVLICLTVCLIPTTIGALLSAIGISGIDRLIQRNVLATSGRAVEAAGDIDVLLLGPARSRWGTARRPRSCLLQALRKRNSPSRLSLHRWRTKLRRAAASSCWQKRVSTCARVMSDRRTRILSLLPPRPG
jgi:potassium-transporting ATPase ATP-binding subunit